MTDNAKLLIGNWDVRFNQYLWIYNFQEGGAVSWRDPFNGKSGTGRWVLGSDAVSISWKGSKTTERWTLPISPAGQGGTMTDEDGTGAFSAKKQKSNFSSFAPEGQQDPYACWAASLAWFTKVLPNVTTQSQSSFLNTSNPGQYTREGMITLDGLFSLKTPGFMRRERAKAERLRACLDGGYFPLIIGYKNGPLGGHMNVIYDFTPANNGTVKVMDPWFPDPDKNKAYKPMYEGQMLIGYFKPGTGDSFKFTGGYLTRPFAFYQARPFSNDQFFIMYEDAPGR